jgi:tRNA(adenine34) deaminase
MNDWKHEQWMQMALDQASQAAQAGEVPVGAVIVGPDATLIATGQNRKERDQDPTAHAEVMALREAGKQLQSWRLIDCRLYVTLEPCPMCAGAIIQARIGCLIYGTSDPKTGAIRSVLNIPDSAASNHKLQVIGGILQGQAQQQLKDWFRQKRRPSISPNLC